jgi:DNA-directed RNA polymerase specialized sigma24 family protein
MINCRSVSPKAWEHARQALVFYFTRRHGLSSAEDLAQETLATVLSREDYQFEKEEDFLRVCYGFAGHMLQTARREVAKSSCNSIVSVLEAGCAEMHGLKDAELNVYLNEILRLGKDQLREADWQLIQQSIVLDGNRGAGSGPTSDNSARVKLHRARRKLAQLAGWRQH